MSEPIGKRAMDAILDVTDELRACVRDEFEPYEGVYRINDFGECVSEEDWLNVWAAYPSWWPHAWILADNGQFTSDEVSRMSVEEIEAAYGDPAFEPEYAFYTEAGEDGMM
ncbi:hypothetical protein [Thermophilibacter provencensis]|uniref:Uncharacterized protein n=1 Tax=Thermophilibacter provencensis TaxID=1852386 RepID=A0ABT7V5H4_9ACTN|nr:hypothetical protein [Thermophilibacter provencensis]MDM8271844.1 hypothetical protein [Thermophilibacter provencensis]